MEVGFIEVNNRELQARENDNINSSSVKSYEHLRMEAEGRRYENLNFANVHNDTYVSTNNGRILRHRAPAKCFHFDRFSLDLMDKYVPRIGYCT